MSNSTQLVVLPGTRQNSLGPLPSFVRPVIQPAQSDLERTIKAVLSAKKVAVVVGAGISTAANIPDFRSSTGLFASLKARFPHAKLTSGRDLFDVNAWKDPDTLSLHFGMLAELHKMCGAAQPTAFHQFLKRLDDDGKLSRVYTQNIDGLEEKVGLSYGIPGQDEINSISSSNHRARQDPPLSPRKRNLKRKRDQALPAQLPPTPRSTPPPTKIDPPSMEEPSLTINETIAPTRDPQQPHGTDHPCQCVENSQRPETELDCSSPPSELGHFPSSQLSSVSTVCPEQVNPSCLRTLDSKPRVDPTIESVEPVIVPTRPVRSKPVDPFPRVIPLHGTLKNLSCQTCKHSVLMSDYLPVLEEGEPILCPQCQSFEDARAISGFRTRGVGVLKSGVVLYGEEHNEGDRVGAVTSRDLMRGRRPDLLIVAGTSLKVPGTKRLVKELSKVIKPPPKTPNDSGEEEEEEEEVDDEEGGTTHHHPKKPPPIHTIFLNNEFPSPCGLWKDTFDVWVKGNVDQFIRLVDQERKNQEELKLKKAREKMERERRKEERLFKRAHSTSQITFSSSAVDPTSTGTMTEQDQILALPSSLPTAPLTPTRRRSTPNLQNSKPIQPKLILRVSKPCTKKSSTSCINSKSKTVHGTPMTTQPPQKTTKANPTGSVTGFFKTGKAAVKSEPSKSTMKGKSVVPPSSQSLSCKKSITTQAVHDPVSQVRKGSRKKATKANQ